LAALDCLTLAIRNYHDAGNIAVIGVPLANLAVLLDRLGRHESAATILGFAFNPMTSAMATYAYDQIDQARVELAQLR
jgi:hypothetical protein